MNPNLTITINFFKIGVFLIAIGIWPLALWLLTTFLDWYYTDEERGYDEEDMFGEPPGWIIFYLVVILCVITSLIFTSYTLLMRVLY